MIANDQIVPRVTVIIAAFNAEPYIAKAILSAQNQTIPDIEIIIVDDGSTDKTASVAQQIAANDTRVVVISLAGNRGVSAARNAALAVARGTWMAVLDADDEYAAERLERMLAYADQHGVDMVADNLAMHDFTTGASLGQAFPNAWMNTGQDVDMSYILERDIPGLYDREIGFFKPVIKMALLTKNNIRYDETIYSAEDFLLYAACLIAGGRMRFMPESYYLYAIRPGSLSSFKKSSESNKRVSEILLGSLKHHVGREAELLRLRRSASCYELFIWHMRNRRFADALREASEMPIAFLWRKLFAFGLRRIGRQTENPSRLALEAIRRHA